MRIGQKPPSGAVAFAAAAVSTLPQMRPWKYFNEFVGGTTNAYKSFNDEGVNLGQRSKELAEYYKQELKPKGLRAYVRLSPNAVAHTPKSLSMQSFWFVLRWGFFFPQSYRVSFWAHFFKGDSMNRRRFLWQGLCSSLPFLANANLPKLVAALPVSKQNNVDLKTFVRGLTGPAYSPGDPNYEDFAKSTRPNMTRIRRSSCILSTCRTSRPL